MGPIKGDPEKYQNAISRVGTLDDVIAELLNALGPNLPVDNRPPEFLKGNVYPRATAYKGVPTSTVYMTEKSIPQARKLLQQSIAEREIARAAAILRAPDELFVGRLPTGVSPQPMATQMPGSNSLAQIAGKLGPVLTLLDLFTVSPELNKGEDKALEDKRGPAYSNRPEYERLLQQAIQEFSTSQVPR